MDNVREDRRKNQRRICRGKGRLYIARTPAMKKKFFKVKTSVELHKSILFLFNQNPVTDSKNYETYVY